MQGDLLFNTWAKTVAVMVTRKDILTNDTPNIRAFVTRWEQEIHAVYDEWGSISSADVTIDTWGTDQLNKMATRLTVNQNHIDAIKLAYTTIPMSEVQKFQGLLATDTGSAKSVGRDERRVADIDQLKLALRLYYGEKGNYPSKLAMLVPTINTVPTDPKTGVPYKYAALSVSDTSRCSSYHLGAILEVVDYPALSTDSDAQPKTVCSGSGPDFSGTDPVFDITK